MHPDYWSYIPRRPRHTANDGTGLVVIERRDGHTPGRVPATLLDFSREGARLRVGVALTRDEPIRLRIQLPDSQQETTIDGKVCWRRCEPGGSWSFGCSFDRAIEWDMLGEMFLNELLVAEAVS